MEIMLLLNEGPMTFNEMKKKLKVSPTTLSRRITEIEKYNLITSSIVEKGRKKINYLLTDKGRKIIPFIKKIMTLSQNIENEVFKED